MEVKATKRGFDGLRLRGILSHNDDYEPEVFDFTGFRINEDGSNNLGSWMELTEAGEKEFKKATNAFERAQAKKAKAKEKPSET